MSSGMIEIYVFLRHDEDNATGLRGLRAATWAGETNWPGAPVPGSAWSCCDDSSVEFVKRVTFRAPTGESESGLAIEVHASREKLRHLVDEHAFQATVAE